MYLQNPEKLQLKLSAAGTLVHFTCSHHVIASAGMELPQVSTNGRSNGTTAVDMTPAAGSGKTIQVTHFTIYNADATAQTVTISKNDGTEDIQRVAILQPGATLEWTRETGWIIYSSSTDESVLITGFTSSGTYTKTNKFNRALVVGIGAGGGGGAGARDAAGTNRFGGGGGAGASLVYRMIGYSDMPSTVTVTIGTGGAGGAGNTNDTSKGENGSAGGDTSFGAILIAKGGGGGTGGSTASGAGGIAAQATACLPAAGPFAFGGTSGGTGAAGNGNAGTTGLSGINSCPSGGGGGGISSANAVATAGGSGGSIYVSGFVTNGPTSGASPNGASNVATTILLSTSYTAPNGIGTGGAGGFGTTFKDGGNGGNYGAGGGGGAATLNGTTSGAGGTGGGGLVLVMEIY